MIYYPTTSLKIRSLPFRYTFPIFGHDWEPHHCQWWRRWYWEFAQSSKLSWGTINVHHPYATTPPLSRLYQLTPLLLQMPSIYLWPLSNACPSSLWIRLPEPLKPVTSILVGDNVTNNTFLLFFFDTLLPYVFHFTYQNTSLPTGTHKSPNTCPTCVCFMVNTPLPHTYHMFNMPFMHVHFTLCHYLNQ
jgi:hypothetical protein